MRKIAGYLTKNRSGKDQKIAQSTHEKECIKTKKTFWRNSKQFLSFYEAFGYYLKEIRTFGNNHQNNAMKKLCYCLLSVFLLANCTTNEKKEIERINDINYSVITDSIYSSIPGTISAIDGNVYWHDATGIENFIHVVNIRSGKELCSFGNKGDGPDDFVLPIPSVSPTKGFFLNDTEKGIEHLYTVDETGTYQIKKAKYERDMETTALAHLDDNTTVNLTPGANNLFKIIANGKVDVCGKFPLSEKYENSFYLYQGQITYNADKNLLVYNCMSLPYLAVYAWKNKALTLEKEFVGEIESSVRDGNLVLEKQSNRGAMELALTKRSIVTLDRDVVTEGEKTESKSPRDLSVLPHSLFVYDYNLNLTHIVNTKFPILRICGDTKTDFMYAIVLAPDYTLIKIDLSSLE